MKININWKPEKRDLIQFGRTFLIGFLVIGSLFVFKKKYSVGFCLGGLALLSGLLTVVAPLFLKPLYYLWMGFGFVMGSIVSRIFLLFIFFVVITPMALIFKIMKRDPLRIKNAHRSSVSTYWETHPTIKDPSYYRHLF